MIKDALIAVQNALTGIPGIEYVAEDWGQLDFYTTRPPVKFPCVLLDAEGADYKDRSRGSQQADASISIRLADYRPVNVSAQAPDSEQAFNIYDTMTDIYKALQGLSGPTFTGLARTRLRKAERDDAIRELVMTFRFGFVDDSAVPRLRSVQVTPRIQVQIETPTS